MPVVSMPTVGAPDGPTTAPPPPPPIPGVAQSPAADALGRVFTTLPVVLRVTCGLAGAAAALAVRSEPVDQTLLLVVVGVLTAWSGWFARVGGRHGLTPALIAVDVALTVGACLLIPRLVAAEVLPGEVSWVAILASTTVIVAQLALRPRWAVPAGLLVTGAYAYGAHLAGNDAEAVAHATTLVVQTASGTALAVVLRRSSRRADLAFAERQRVARDALVARAAREAERRHNRDLHDTALSTLTMVGLGAVRSGSASLRDRAASDLLAFSAAGASAEPPSVSPAAGAPAGGRPAPLDVRLREVAARFPDLPVIVETTGDPPTTTGRPAGPPVRHDPTAADRQAGGSAAADGPTEADGPAGGVRVPAVVAEAIAESAAAALANVQRHAPGATAWLRLTGIAGTVVVEVVDDGPGFDPARVPGHRYGLRESIGGRMAAAGGRATVDSAPGRGARIILEWPDAG
ncbi:ATP-binding protein [Micromonospora sp. WMMD882]|uniref:sensor histidine kinase n=1 Tax=Micromonospora sp. WMMD882 TaxID=3015151 RepID=UPI00248B4234|nr:ATP-binding protein [Micromonospora sp. WMMD882]WBB79561.1 ATP-binding protein [Micromonospora sp. WMMD882]